MVTFLLFRLFVTMDGIIPPYTLLPSNDYRLEQKIRKANKVVWLCGSALQGKLGSSCNSQLEGTI